MPQERSGRIAASIRRVCKAPLGGACAGRGAQAVAIPCCLPRGALSAHHDAYRVPEKQVFREAVPLSDSSIFKGPLR
jgi:hypothetical protein